MMSMPSCARCEASEDWLLVLHSTSQADDGGSFLVAHGLTPEMLHPHCCAPMPDTARSGTDCRDPPPWPDMWEGSSPLHRSETPNEEPVTSGTGQAPMHRTLRRLALLHQRACAVKVPAGYTLSSS